MNHFTPIYISPQYIASYSIQTENISKNSLLSSNNPSNYKLSLSKCYKQTSKLVFSKLVRGMSDVAYTTKELNASCRSTAHKSTNRLDMLDNAL